MTITGRIKKETEKAILISNNRGQRWLPKSQITIFECSAGSYDQVLVSDWLSSKDSSLSILSDY